MIVTELEALKLYCCVDPHMRCQGKECMGFKEYDSGKQYKTLYKLSEAEITKAKSEGWTELDWNDPKSSTVHLFKQNREPTYVCGRADLEVTVEGF